MKFLINILIFVSSIPLSAFGQSMDIQWQKCFGGTDADFPWSIIPTFDHGYIVSGSTESSDDDILYNHGGSDFWVVKLNSTGEIQWQRCYGGSATEYGGGIIQLIDSNYMICGSTTSADGDIALNHGLADAWVLMLATNGDIIWEKTLGGSGGEGFASLRQTLDGGVALIGYTTSNNDDVSGNHGYADLWAVKIDLDGSIAWQKCIGGSEYDDAPGRITEFTNGNLVVCGSTLSDDGDVIGYHGGGDFLIAELDSDGTLLWSKAYGGSGSDQPYSTYIKNDSLISIVGMTNSIDGDVVGLSGPFDSWIINTDTTGVPQWQKCLGGTNSEAAYAIVQGPGNSNIIAGGTDSNDGDVSGNHGEADLWLTQLDSVGNIQFQKCLGGSQDEWAYSIVSTIDSGYIIIGTTTSNDGDVSGNHGSYDYWVVKVSKPCLQHLYYQDSDADGFGNPFVYIYNCSDTIGYISDSTDCNDESADIYPGKTDICNGVDDNCNTLIDEEAIFTTWYQDQDGDNFGNADVDSIACLELLYYVLDSTDCDDSNPSIFPGATEILNGVDDDCDGVSDEGVGIEETAFESITVYPNPVVIELFIKTASTSNIEMQLTDLTGSIIIKRQKLMNPLYLYNYVPGVYFLTLYMESRQAVFPIIKQSDN